MILKERSRKQLAEAIRKTYPVSVRLLLRFGDCTIEVQTNDSEIRAGLHTYFHPFVTTSGTPQRTIFCYETEVVEIGFPLTPKMPDPGKTRIKEEYADLPDGRIVLKRLTGMVFLFGEGDHIAIGPCRKNLNQVVNFINNRHIEWLLDAGGILTHAAGIVLNGKGIALAGFSGMGKSTLSLHFLNIGADFVSNDRLILKRSHTELFMYGVAKLPRINPGTILNNPSLTGLLSEADVNRYSIMTSADLWAVEEKYDAPIDRCFPTSRFLLFSAMHVLIILNWKLKNGSVQILPVCLKERKDLLAAFRKSTGLFYLGIHDLRSGDPGEDVYLQHMEGIPVFEITGGVDFQSVLDFCMDLKLNDRNSEIPNIS